MRRGCLIPKHKGFQFMLETHKKVTEPHVKFYETGIRHLKHHSSEFGSWNDWRSVVRKNSLLQTVHCTELVQEYCYVVSQHPLWTWCFSLTKIFSFWCQNDRVYVPPMTKETRIELLTLVSDFAACVMFMSTAAVLDVYFALVTIKYHASV